MFLLPAAQFRLRLWTSIKTWRQTLSIIFWGSVSSVIQTPTWNHKNAQHCLIISSQGLWFKRGIGEAGEGCPVGIWEGHQGTCDTPSFPNDIQMISKWYPNMISMIISCSCSRSSINHLNGFILIHLDLLFWIQNCRMLRRPARRQREVWRRSRVPEAWPQNVLVLLVRHGIKMYHGDPCHYRVIHVWRLILSYDVMWIFTRQYARCYELHGGSQCLLVICFLHEHRHQTSSAQNRSFSPPLTRFDVDPLWGQSWFGEKISGFASAGWPRF